MWLWWMRTTVSVSKGILVSSSMTEGAWGPGWGGDGGQLVASGLRGSVPQGKALLEFLPYAPF